MRVSIRAFAIVAILAAAHPAVTLTLPVAPEGFAWQETPDIRGAILLPEGWHFSVGRQEAKLAYFATRDKIENGTFTTGITLNVIRAVPGSLGVSPSAFARDLVMQIRNTERIEHSWTEREGVFNEFGIEWVDRDEVVWVRNHHRLLANDGTGTLYHVTFRCPADDWQEAWPAARQVLDGILLDDEI